MTYAKKLSDALQTAPDSLFLIFRIGNKQPGDPQPDAAEVSLWRNARWQKDTGYGKHNRWEDPEDLAVPR